MNDRYSRQVLFPGVGKEGQKRLGGSFVVVVGCGALGTISATELVRAGVGRVRIIDRDFIEYHNLQRQVLFDESDIEEGLPKAVAAERHLRRVNSSIHIEGVVADVNYTNVERLIDGASVVVDGLDNFETRLLLNDACAKMKIPWVYGGAISSLGMTMTVIPGEPPCFRCLAHHLPGGAAILTCDTAGVISPVPSIIGSLQVAEAIKLLVGAREKINRGLVFMDVWEGSFERLTIHPRSDCPTCQGNYEFLAGSAGIKSTSLCGQNAVQIVNTGAEGISLEELARRLQPVATVRHNKYMLSFTVNNQEMVVFPDGRAILKNTTDESLARGLYAKYVGV